jgi:hypothetical protein
MPSSELRHRPMTRLKLHLLYELIIMGPKFMSNMVHKPLAPLNPRFKSYPKVKIKIKDKQIF